MRTLKWCAMAGLVLAALVNGAAWALPTVAQADNLARSALALNKYAEVVKVYGDQKPDDLGALSYYRLAIAQQKLGDGAAANRALDQALSLNPKATFASSPERLSRLKNDILKTAGGEKSGVPVDQAAPTLVEPASLPPPEAVGEASAGIEKPISAVEAIAQPYPAVGADLARPALEAIQAKRPLAATNIAPLPDWTPYITAFVLIITFGLFAFFYKLGLKKREEEMANGLHDVLVNTKLMASNETVALQAKLDRAHEELAQAKAKARYSVSDVGDLVFLRNEVTKVRELIDLAGTRDSLLSKALEKLEPLVAMEIGRNHFRLSRDPSVLVHADQQMLSTVMNLEQAPLTLDGADPEEVMRYFRGGGDRFAQTLNVPTQEKKVA